MQPKPQRKGGESGPGSNDGKGKGKLYPWTNGGRRRGVKTWADMRKGQNPGEEKPAK